MLPLPKRLRLPALIVALVLILGLTVSAVMAASGNGQARSGGGLSAAHGGAVAKKTADLPGPIDENRVAEQAAQAAAKKAAEPTAAGADLQSVVNVPMGQSVAPADNGKARIIVGFKANVGAAQRDEVHKGVVDRGAAKNPRKVDAVGNDVDVVEADVTQSVDAAVAEYKKDPRVAYAEVDKVNTALETPNDPYFGYQWDMTKIQAPTGWNVTHGSASVKVAVLDTGVDDTHPDLAGKVVLKRNFSNSTDTLDRVGHGTHVSGTVAAISNNSIGVAGLAPATSLMMGKVLNDSGSGYDSWIANGIYWAADNGAKVISMSLGGPGSPSTTMQNALNYAWARNVVIVAAAGNAGNTSVTSPASGAHVVSVASTGSSDAKSSFSTYGTWVTVAAPGESIVSTYPGARYASMSGTSMATPHVSGLAALVWATSYGSGAQAVVDRITGTADKIAGTGSYWQAGRINVAKAVGGSTLPTPTPTPLPTATPIPTPPPTTTSLSVSPTSVAAGGTVTVSWSGIANPSPYDWIGLYKPGTADSSYLDWVRVSGTKYASTARASGSITYTMPTTGGTYEFRLFANATWTKLATSGQVTVGSAPAPTATPVPGTTPSTADQQAVQAALGYINQSRAQYGLPAFTLYDPLRQVSQNYANDMAARNYFSHYSPEGLGPADRMAAAGIYPSTWGENLGYGYGYGSPTASVYQNHQAMMAETPPNDGHRQNILNPNFHRIGIGVKTDSSGKTYYVTDFIN